MTLLEKLREKLGAELFSQVEEAAGDDFDWDFVPRARLNKVIGQRNALSTKLQNLMDKDENESNESSDPEGNEAKGSSAEAEIQKLTAAHQKELGNIAKRYAVLDQIRAKGALDPKLVLGQIDLDKINLKDDDTLEGFEEQFNPWAESHSYMFQSAADNSASESESIESGTGKEASGASEETMDPFDAVIATIK